MWVPIAVQLWAVTVTHVRLQSRFNSGFWPLHSMNSNHGSAVDWDQQCELQPWFRHGLWPSQGELQPWLSCVSWRSHTVCSSHSPAVYCDHHTVWAPVIVQLWILSVYFLLCRDLRGISVGLLAAVPFCPMLYPMTSKKFHSLSLLWFLSLQTSVTFFSLESPFFLLTVQG